MLIEWRLQPWSDMFHNVFIVGIDTEKIQAGRGTFGTYLIFNLEIKTLPNSLSKNEDIFLISGMIGSTTDQFYSAWNIPAQTISPNRSSIIVPITEKQIEAIEEMRNGGPVLLNIQLTAVSTIWAKTDESNTKTKTATTLNENNPTKYMKIEREKWVELLTQLGQSKTKIIEIPMPILPKKTDIWIETVIAYEKVIYSEKQGDFLHAMQESRKVVEGIIDVILTNWSLSKKGRMGDQLKSIEDRLIKIWGDDQKEKVQSLSSLLKTVWDYTSPSHHYGRGYSESRFDVKFIIELIAALLMFVGSLLERYSNEESLPLE